MAGTPLHQRTEEGSRSCSSYELLINKACNSRLLTVGGRWAAARHRTDRGSQSCLLNQPPARQQQSYCLNTNTRTGCWRSNTVTRKTETSLFLNLGIFFLFSFFSFSLNASLVHCWLVHHLSLLISLVLYFFFFFPFILLSSYSFFLDLLTFTIVS
jgi:hypothetical protein